MGGFAGAAGLPPQTLLRLGEASSLGRGQAGPAAGGVLPPTPTLLSGVDSSPALQDTSGGVGGWAEQPRARLCCLPGAAVPSVATAQLSPRRGRPGPLVLYFAFVLPSPHSLETPSPCSHTSVSTTALELLDWGLYFMRVPRPAGFQARGPQDAQQISKR